MEIRGDLLTDKENAGAALLDACKMCIRDRPYDVVVERLHIEEPEPPATVTEPEKTFEEVLDEHPVAIQVNGQWQTFPNADVYKRQAPLRESGTVPEQLEKLYEQFNPVSYTHLPWFQSHGQWGARGYNNLAPGDAIFFDWDLDGTARCV